MRKWIVSMVHCHDHRGGLKERCLKERWTSRALDAGWLRATSMSGKLWGVSARRDRFRKPRSCCTRRRSKCMGGGSGDKWIITGKASSSISKHFTWRKRAAAARNGYNAKPRNRLYGIRSAVRGPEEEHMATMWEVGVVPGTYTPSVFRQQTGDFRCAAHDEDITFAGGSGDQRVAGRVGV